MQETRTPDSAEVLATLGPDHRSARFGQWRWRAMLAAAVMGLGAIGWWWLAPSEAMVTYKTEAALRDNLTVNITATGQLAPVNEVDVGSELSGTVKQVNVDFNDKVTAGQVLATLDTQELDAQVVQQQAALAVARARVEQVDATVNEATLKQRRVADLVKQNLASQEDLDASSAALTRARADLAGARAQVMQSSAALDAIRTRLSKTVIRAPINGIVLNRAIEPGQTVAASFNTPVLFSLAEDLTRMALHVDVDEADVGHLKENQPAHFTVDAWPGRTFDALVTQVRFAPRTVDGVVTYETLLSVDNQDLSLRPGMTATAEITVATIEDALLVPNAALRYSPQLAAATESTSTNLFTRLMPRHPRGNSAHAANLRSGEAGIWILEAGQPRQAIIEVGMSNGRYTVVKGGGIAVDDPVITGEAVSR